LRARRARHAGGASRGAGQTPGIDGAPLLNAIAMPEEIRVSLFNFEHLSRRDRVLNRIGRSRTLPRRLARELRSYALRPCVASQRYCLPPMCQIWGISPGRQLSRDRFVQRAIHRTESLVHPTAILPRHRYRSPAGDLRHVRSIKEAVVRFTEVAPLIANPDVSKMTDRVMPLTRFAAEAVREVTRPG
jgi:hypothetical protein